MTSITVRNTEKLEGVVEALSSKSITIRAVVAATLASGKSIILNPLYSSDTESCIKLCSQLGAEIKKEKDKLVVEGTGGNLKIPEEILDAGNSGTTIRILTAVSSLCKEEVTLTGDESIQKRPIKPLTDALEQLGVKVSSKNGFPPVKVRGPIVGGVCRIRGDVSSQFISALLMTLPCAGKDSVVDVTTELKSKPYIYLTLDVLDHFKVRCTNTDYKKFFVPGKQTYTAGRHIVEGDYSSVAFILAAAALTNSRVQVKNLFSESKQADKKIIEILRQMGADVKVGEYNVVVEGSGKLRGITVDLSDSPDLVPIMAVLGALADGRTELVNVEHARLKECDRIRAMATELGKMGAHVVEKQDGLIIEGGKLVGARVDGWHDHRIIMALAVAGLAAEGETTISDAEYVSVTFPNFVEIIQKLGAKIAINS